MSGASNMPRASSDPAHPVAPAKQIRIFVTLSPLLHPINEYYQQRGPTLKCLSQVVASKQALLFALYNTT
jgi:hypothetical protein